MSEDTKPFCIGVEEVKENEDGSATYTFVMDDAASRAVNKLGLQFILYCGAAGVDIQDALDWILDEARDSK